MIFVAIDYDKEVTIESRGHKHHSCRDREGIIEIKCSNKGAT